MSGDMSGADGLLHEANRLAHKAARAGVLAMKAQGRAYEVRAEDRERYAAAWAERNQKMLELAVACRRYEEMDLRRLKEATA